MTELQQLINAFNELSLEDKKNKLILILEDLKGKKPIFDQLLDVIQNNPRIDDEFLSGVYSDIMEYAVFVHDRNKEKSLQTLDTTLQGKMKKLHERELTERAQENPDELLNNL